MSDNDRKNKDDTVESWKEKLEIEEAKNARLREQLFAVQAQRVRMQGYLYKFKPYPIGIFNSAWERRYFSLVDSCLKCFRSDEMMALIPDTEIFVQDCTIQWEGKKRHHFWTFALKDRTGCVVIRLSSDDRSSAAQWISALESAGAVESQFRHLPRMRSLPSHTTENVAETRPRKVDLPDHVEPTEEKKKVQQSMVGSTPVHMKTQASILSSERLFQHPHPGLLNLATVILLAANFRLVLENVFKYGWRVNPLRWFELFLWGSSQPLMLCWPVLGACTCFAFLIEKMAIASVHRHEARKKKTDQTPRPEENWVVSLHVVNVLLCFLVPVWLVLISVNAVLPSFVVTLVTLVVVLKLISFAHCNADLRKRYFEDPSHSIYPSNITLSNLCYFMAAPTLTYQPSYPRTERIRGNWLLRRCGELVLALALQLAIIDQYIVPAVENSMVPMQNRDFIALVERVLKLSLPVLYAWLTMFYIVFHLWLNILAEALKFGDREFYLDWWNALNLGDYWKTWNTPVHKWMLRTIYYPAIHRGDSFDKFKSMYLILFRLFEKDGDVVRLLHFGFASRSGGHRSFEIHKSFSLVVFQYDVSSAFDYLFAISSKEDW